MRNASQRRVNVVVSAFAIFIAISAIVLTFWGINPSYREAAAALPTLQIMPSDTLTLTPTDTLTPSPTFTLTPSATPTPTETPVPLEELPTQTATLEPSATPIPISITVKIKEKAGTQARSGPGISYDVVSDVKFGDVYSALAMGNDFFNHTWYLITLSNGEPAWILAPATDVISNQQDAAKVAIAVTIPPTPTLKPTLTLTPGNALEAQLQAVPVLSGVTSDLRDIYLKGQSKGNKANVFAKVGDCNTVADSFLAPLDKGSYSLGRYAPLQNTIAYYKGSFARQSIAAEIGFNVITVQDPFWADPNVCYANESSLRCEYRVSKPSIAVVMFGANDVLFLTPKLYQENMRKIVQQSLDQGIIPVLTTFTWHDYGPMRQKAMEFDMIDVNLSREYHIPLINFWLASQYLPGHGISPDNAHLSWSVHGLIFTGEESQWGESLRSLLTLEMLDNIRHTLAS